MVVKDEKANKGNELDFKKFSPQNQEKSAVETLMTNGYLDANGLNEVALNTFLNNSPSGVSQKIFQEQNEIDKQNKAISDLKLSIDDSGNIYSKTSQNTDPIIGRINIVLKNGSVEKYEVVDLDNYIIGTWFASLGTFKGYDKFLNQEIITYDNKVFPIKFDNSGNFVGYKMSKDVTAMNIIFKLILNGYQLKHQFTNR